MKLNVHYFNAIILCESIVLYTIDIEKSIYIRGCIQASWHVIVNFFFPVHVRADYRICIFIEKFQRPLFSPEKKKIRVGSQKYFEELCDDDYGKKTCILSSTRNDKFTQASSPCSFMEEDTVQPQGSWNFTFVRSHFSPRRVGMSFALGPFILHFRALTSCATGAPSRRRNFLIFSRDFRRNRLKVTARAFERH